MKGYQEGENIQYCCGLHMCYSAVKGYQEWLYSEISYIPVGCILATVNKSVNIYSEISYILMGCTHATAQ